MEVKKQEGVLRKIMLKKGEGKKNNLVSHLQVSLFLIFVAQILRYASLLRGI